MECVVFLIQGFFEHGWVSTALCWLAAMAAVVFRVDCEEGGDRGGVTLFTGMMIVMAVLGFIWPVFRGVVALINGVT